MTAPDGKVLWGGPPYIDSPKQAGLAPMLKSTPHADMDRRAAEAVLRHGGTVVIRVGEAEAEIKPSNGLPAATFRLVRVRLDHRPELVDTDLEPLRGLTDIVEVNLRNTQLTNAGLVNLGTLARL